MSQKQQAKADGVDTELRLNNSSVYLMVDLADALGAVDETEAGPRIPASAEDHQIDAAWTRWEATQRQRVDLTPELEVKFPAIKLGSHAGWLILPKEARALARAMRALTPTTVQAVLEADEDELAAISDPAVVDPPDMATAVANVLEKASRFAEFCEIASKYGGFRAS